MKPIKVLTPAQLAKEIKRRNRIFRKATAAGKRVLIAKDVLEQLALGRIRAREGTFLDVKRNMGDHVFNFDRIKRESLQTTFLRGDIESCEACADGALMLSCTLFNNKYASGERFSNMDNWIDSKKPMKNKLNVIFSRAQLRLIENAFELGSGAFSKAIPTPEIKRAVAFGRRFKFESTRLVWIMKNIIKNKGTFIP